MQNTSTLWAQKSNGTKRQFTRIAWDLLGKNKEDWVEVAEQPVTNIVANKLKKPSTGDQKVLNVATRATNQTVSNESNKKEDTEHFSEEQKQQFIDAAKGLNAGPIKDYFDSQEPRIEFDKKLGKPAMIEKLGEVLKYDIVELQKLFN